MLSPAAHFLTKTTPRRNCGVLKGALSSQEVHVVTAMRQSGWVCAGTGGIVDLENWRNINWQPINALTGGTLQFPTGLGLKPWYLQGFQSPTVPGQSVACFHA